MRIITGDEDVQTNREIRVSPFSPACSRAPRSSPHRTARRPKPINVFPDRRAPARGRPLVLSRRPRHQACLLVHRRREGKDLRGPRRKLRRRRPTPLRAAEQRQHAILDRQRARRIARSADRASSRNPASSPAQRPPATIAGTISPENDQRANAGDAGADRSVVASRWLELASIGYVGAVPRPSGGQFRSKRAGFRFGSSQRRAASRRIRAPARAATHRRPRPSGSVQMLLIAILGALALAGLLASAIFRFGRLTGARHGSRVTRRAARELGCGQDRCIHRRRDRCGSVEAAAGARFPPRSARGG